MMFVISMLTPQIQKGFPPFSVCSNDRRLVV